MIRSVGLDVHRREIEVRFLDGEGRSLQRCSLPCTAAAITAFAQAELLPTDQVALEATLNSWAVARLLRPFVGRVVVSNPLQTRAIAQAKVKTDKIDALVLAQLLRNDYLPEVWQPDLETEERRTLCHRRASLVSERVRLKNRIHSVLAQLLIPLPKGGLFTGRGEQWLRSLELPSAARALIDSDQRLLLACEAEMELVDKQLIKAAYADPKVKLMMTLPGVDFVVALTVLAALGDIDRFPDGDHAAAYLGIVPSTHQSGDRCYHGPITRRGSSRARWLLIQAAQHVGAHPGPLGVFFRRLLRKKNRNVAVVAAARKLVVIAWHMLKNNEPYRYAQPEATRTKLSRLRVKASAQKRGSGTPKGTPRSEAYGTGRGTRHVPSLPEVYKAEGLPPARGPEEIAAGEKRFTEETGVAEHHRSIQEPRRRLRSTKAGPQGERVHGVPNPGDPKVANSDAVPDQSAKSRLT